MYEDLIEKKVSSEAIFDGVLLHVKRDTVELPNGKEATREWIKHPGASSVIPILPDGRIILVRFGWAKPVIIDPRNFRKPRRDDILVSLAGPAANLVTAFLALVALLVLKSTMGHLSFGVYQVFQLIIIYNINFAIFNLIPLPPLDGSHVLMQLLPPRMAYRYARLERYSFLILIALIMTPVLSMIFIPLQRLIWQIFVLLLMPFF